MPSSVLIPKKSSEVTATTSRRATMPPMYPIPQPRPETRPKVAGEDTWVSMAL